MKNNLIEIISLIFGFVGLGLCVYGILHAITWMLPVGWFIGVSALAVSWVCGAKD